MIGGELEIQVYDKKEVGTIQGTPYDASGTETRLNVLVNCMYALNYAEGEGGFFVTFGGGIYGGLGGVLDLQIAIDEALQGIKPDEDGVAFGVNGGLLYTHMVSESYGLFVMPRFHFVFLIRTPRCFRSQPVYRFRSVGRAAMSETGGNRTCNHATAPTRTSDHKFVARVLSRPYIWPNAGINNRLPSVLV